MPKKFQWISKNKQDKTKKAPAQKKTPELIIHVLKCLLCKFGRHIYFYIHPVGSLPRSDYHRIIFLR